jgi:hypothetical protein
VVSLRPGRFTPGERPPRTHWIGGWLDPRAGLDDVEKRKFLTLPGLELRPFSRPACSQALCRLRYCKHGNVRISEIVAHKFNLLGILLIYSSG